MELATGQIVAGDYRVVHRLAAGGMGAVYVAEQLSTGKKRALKVMHRELVDDHESLRRFLQEARVGSLIASEHIVEVQTAGIDVATGSPFLVMELLEGEDLARRVARGPLALEETIEILGQLGHALGAAHDSNVVHRDLKPENIFLSVRRAAADRVQVKILDFGIAKIAEKKNSTSAMGTPMWQAPEQTERGVITPAADVWAFGLVVFRLLTSRFYWRTPALEGRGRSLVALLAEILRAPLPAASARAAELGCTLPAGFDAWFARCVVRDPRERFQHARDAYDQLAPILNSALTAPSLAAARLQPGSATLPTPPHAGVAPMLAGTTGALGGGPPVTAPHLGASPPHGGVAAVAGPRVTPPPYVGPLPSGDATVWKVVLVGVALVVAFGMIAVLALVWVVGREATGPEPPAPSPTGVAPTPYIDDDDGTEGRIGGMVISENPAVQDAVNHAFHTALTPKLEECVAHTRGAGSVTLIMRARRDGTLEPTQTIADVAGPHVTCISDIFASLRVPPQPRDAAVQIMVFIDEH